MPLCQPWVDAESVELCTADPVQLDRAVAAASSLLYALSGRQFSGQCSDTVRPCRWADGCWAPYRTWDAWGRPPQVGCLCPGPVGCSSSHEALPLPHGPVIEVTEVLVDGTAIDLSDLVIVDDRWVVRRDPAEWPTVQLLDRTAAEADTWQVTYTYGTRVPPDGVLAAERLACELVRGWAPGDAGDCALPPNVTSVIAENVSYDVNPVPDQVASALLALGEVAAFIGAHNPNGLARRGRLINPRAHRPRRHRRVRPGGPGGTADIYFGGTPGDTGEDVYFGGTPSDTGDDVYFGGSP